MRKGGERMEKNYKTGTKYTSKLSKLQTAGLRRALIPHLAATGDSPPALQPKTSSDTSFTSFSPPLCDSLPVTVCLCVSVCARPCVHEPDSSLSQGAGAVLQRGPDLAGAAGGGGPAGGEPEGGGL